MELFLGFSIVTFIAVVSIDTLHQGHLNIKHIRTNTHDKH